MIVIWRTEKVVMDVMHGCNRQIVDVFYGSNVKPWLLLGIHVSTDYRLRWVLWEETSRLMDLDLSSLIVEDFNYIDGSQEKRGDGRSRIVSEPWNSGSLLVKMV